MSDEKNPVDNPEAGEQELSQTEMEGVSAGVSLNFTTLQWEYTKQDDTGAVNPSTKK